MLLNISLSFFVISIHALRKESDNLRTGACRHRKISIHALRKESDRRLRISGSGHRYFNPRSP